jgi:metal-responsive CopG/Arc/MetJ family transcriptional regulator
MPSNNKIQVYLPGEILERLKNMAKKQNRSASNLAASFVIQSIEREEGDQNNYDEAIALIAALASNTKPTDANVILAAHELNIEPESLFQIRDRLFKEGKQPNGV